MKKLLSFIMSMLILMGISGISANAESIPIKKIDSDFRNVYALLENGILVKDIRPAGEYKHITPNTKSEIVAEDVADFRADTIALSGRLTILFSDGVLKKETNNSNFEIVDTNVDQMLNDSTYLKNGTAYYNNYTYDNIKQLLFMDNTGLYLLDNNDTLFVCINDKKIKIADDILGVDKDSKRIFNKNNEILSFDLDTSKGTVQLNLLTNQVSYENFCSGIPITNDNRIISYSKDRSDILEGPQNVSKIAYYKTDSYTKDSNIYYLSLDNKLIFYDKYYYVYPITSKYGENRELYDGETFKYAFREFAIGTNNNLYSLSLNDRKTLIDTDVDMPLFHDSPYSTSIIYLKNNGEIYYYNKDKNYQNDIKYYKPFLYPLAQKQNKVVFNGNEIQLEDSIQIKNGRSMYPFRAILEAMGASVMWDGTNQKAIGTLDGNRVEFKIGTDEYIVNGETKYMDTQSYVDSMTSKTYIPIRYVAEALGFSVDWQPGDMENLITIEN